MPKKIYKTKVSASDKAKTINSLSEFAEAIILLADRQDKFDDIILKLSHKQDRLLATFDNLISVTNLSKEIFAPINSDIKNLSGEIVSIKNRLNNFNQTTIIKRFKTNI